MSNVDDRAAQAEANMALMRKLAPLVELLNAFSDSRVPWQVCFGRKDYVDAMGELIPAGRDHYRKGHPSPQEDEVRLSAASMKRLVDVLFAHNREGIELARRVRADRFGQLERELLGATGSTA